jgi:hypothetical protein
MSVQSLDSPIVQEKLKKREGTYLFLLFYFPE